MPWDEGNFVAERPELGANRTDQGGVVATRKIGAADRALKQHVPDQCNLVGAAEEHDMPRGVARAVENLELGFADLHPIAVLQPAIGLERLDVLEAVTLALGDELGDPELVLALRPFDRDIERTCKAGRTAAVIDVPVGDQDFFDFDTQLCYCAADALEVTAGIDDRSAQGGLANCDRAILLERRDRDDGEFHGADMNYALSVSSTRAGVNGM